MSSGRKNTVSDPDKKKKMTGGGVLWFAVWEHGKACLQGEFLTHRRGNAERQAQICQGRLALDSVQTRAPESWQPGPGRCSPRQDLGNLQVAHPNQSSLYKHSMSELENAPVRRSRGPIPRHVLCLPACTFSGSDTDGRTRTPGPSPPVPQANPDHARITIPFPSPGRILVPNPS